MNEAAAGFFLWLALGLAWLIYSPGLKGIFLLDDFVILHKLSEFGDLSHPPTFLYYVFGSGHNFGGRPLAHLSFLIDDNAWPSIPEHFKHTNVLLHLLAGTLVLWLGLLIGRARGLGERTAAWGALLGAALWLLHPLWVSTTLYVVQRMAILSAILVLAGLTTYVSGRLRLARGHVRSGLAGMALGIGVFTPLAFLSKENGALLPLLALATELTVLRGLPVPERARRAYRVFAGFLLVAPNLAITVYFAAAWESVLAGYERRTFSLGDRLLTEPRALWSYLRELVLPRIQTGGLYHDDYPASENLLSPWTTLPALLGLVLSVYVAVRAYKNRPLLSFAIFFFLAGHLLESSFIPLELYFEHRNYLPAVGIFISLGLVSARLTTRARTPTARRALMAGAAVVTISLAGLTWLRATLWGDPETQALLWARTHPGSLRAQQQAAITWLGRGRPDLAEIHIRTAIEHHPKRPTLRLQLIAVLCAKGERPTSAIDDARRAISQGFIDTATFQNLERLLDLAYRQQCPGLDLDDVSALARSVLEHPAIIKLPTLAQSMLYIRALVALFKNRPQEAAKTMELALRLAPHPEFALQAAAVLATHGLYDEALHLLNLHDNLQRKIMPTSFRARLRYFLRRYDDEKHRLRRLIMNDRERAIHHRHKNLPITPGNPHRP